MIARSWLLLVSACAVTLSACGSVRPSEIRIEAISNDNQEPVPCAIYVDGELQKDAAGEPLKTPASLALVFKDDPSGAHASQGVAVAVYPLLSDNGTLRLPQDESGDFPPFRFDRYAQRLVRRSDARTQLFILLPNSDRRAYSLPRRGAPVNLGN